MQQSRKKPYSQRKKTAARAHRKPDKPEILPDINDALRTAGKTCANAKFVRKHTPTFGHTTNKVYLCTAKFKTYRKQLIR